MPEGPTLIGFKNKLQHLAGSIITAAGGYNNPFIEEMEGRRLREVATYGKNLIFQLEDFFLNVHFVLFGSFLIDERKKVNAAFSFSTDTAEVNFYVVKVRRQAGHYENHYNLHLDPFHPNFTLQLVLEKLATRPQKRIGEVLMDQEIFPGLGNIIRNEVLYLAKIHPESTVEHIPQNHLENLINTYQKFTKASVELIDKKIWKSSAAVYKKERPGVTMYIDPKLKRKTYVDSSVQHLYL